MSKENIKLTNDDIYTEIRSDNEDSINFFKGSEITILKKNIDDPIDEKAAEELAGLEKLVLGFSASKERLEFNQSLLGRESRELPKRNIVLKVIDEVIRFIREVGRWLYSLLTNRIARTENSLNFLEQRRKSKGIQTKPVSYLNNIDLLVMPSVVSDSPSWTLSAASIGLDFYKKSIIAHKKLMDAINEKPSNLASLKEQKSKVLADIGRIMTNGNVNKDGFVTDILPGNKLFTVSVNNLDRNSTPFIFVDSPSFVRFNSKEWIPTSGVIDGGLSLLKDFIREIKKEQSNTNTLSRNFERKVKESAKEADHWTVAYYNWLTEINRRLVSLTFQHTMRWYDSLENFISSGVNK